MSNGTRVRIVYASPLLGMTGTLVVPTKKPGKLTVYVDLDSEGNTCLVTLPRFGAVAI